jgi:DNA-binding response OmpR family regulator
MRLLLAEDERALSDALTAILTSKQYEVDTVFDGESAVEYALRNQYDGIIMDIMMPKMNGFDAIAEIRNHGVVTPVIVLSAKGEVSDKVLGLELGANDYLPKPFSTDELLARIGAMLRKKVDKPETLSLGNAVLNIAERELCCKEANVGLSGKECLMMEIMMKAPDVSISAERFLSEVWSDDQSQSADVVRLYAAYLIKKLSVINAELRIVVIEPETAVKLKTHLSEG